MSIYAEYLFIENVLIGYVILYLTTRLCAVRVKGRRLLGGAVLCGLYAFILLATLHPLVLLASKLAASVLIIFVVFREKKPRLILKYCLTFYAVTIILAGMCFFVIYTGLASGVAGGAGFYIETGTYGSIIIGISIGLIGILRLWEHLRVTSVQERITADITVRVMDNIYEISGIVDTGNFLKDPFTGQPVIIADKQRMPDCMNAQTQNRMRIIPYQALGNESGVMEGLRADSVSISYSDQVVVQAGPIIGLYEGSLFENKKYGAIIHPAMLVKI